MPKLLALDEADPDGAASRMGDSPVTSDHLVRHHVNVARARRRRLVARGHHPTIRSVSSRRTGRNWQLRADSVATVHLESDAAR
jgi:hypothetical protein